MVIVVLRAPSYEMSTMATCLVRMAASSWRLELEQPSAYITQKVQAPKYDCTSYEGPKAIMIRVLGNTSVFRSAFYIHQGSCN